mmetsp:Transcript_6021/g.19607  ORF Transcript_6021/g.19607 Transcript_6021/m.19607 type:complete len:88 (+) Transcript_6021:786-1049(+)
MNCRRGIFVSARRAANIKKLSAKDFLPACLRARLMEKIRKTPRTSLAIGKTNHRRERTNERSGLVTSKKATLVNARASRREHSGFQS